VNPPQAPRRDLTLPHSVALVAGIIIGTGIFLKPAVMAQAVGTPALVLAAWVIAGAIAMLGALSFAELGALLPHAGGEYVYLREAYGEAVGFLFAFNSFLIGGATLAAYGAAFAIFCSDIHPLGDPWLRQDLSVLGRTFELELGARQALAVGVILFFTAINCIGVAAGGRTQALLTTLKVLATLALAGGAFLLADTPGGSNLFAAPASGAGAVSGLGMAVLAALWAYSGWQYLPMAAAEVRDPGRTIPRAIVGGTAAVLVLYALVNLAFLHALPFEQVATANSTAYPDAPSVATRAAQTFLGSQAASFAALVFLLSTIGSLNGVLLGRARVPYAAARDGLFFRAFGRLGARSRAPVASIVLTSLWAVVLAATGTFDQLTNMAVLTYAVFWIPVVLAVIVLRRRHPDAARPYRVPGYPWTPIAFVLVMTWVVVSALITRPAESFATLGLILLGLPFYPLFRRRLRLRPSPAPTGRSAPHAAPRSPHRSG